MKKKLSLILALCMLFTLCVCVQTAALAETPAQIPENIAGQEIVMWTFLDPVSGTTGRETALAKMIEQFEAETGAKVTVEPIEHSTLQAKFLAAHNVGNAPDIVWITVGQLGGCIQAGALEPLDALFMNDWTAEQWADADSIPVKSGVTEDGVHYQLPFSVNSICLIYRADLLEEAGYTFEGTETFENWAEFCKAAETLTVEKDELTGAKRYGYGGVYPASGGDPNIGINMLLGVNGSLIHEDGTANFANEAGVNAIAMIKDLYDRGLLSSTCVTDTIENLYEDFKAGKYAMITGPSTRLANIIEGASFDPSTIRMMPYPCDNGDLSPAMLGGWCAGVWSGSENKTAAGKFLEFMFLNDYLWVTEGGQPPVLASTVDRLESEGFFDDPTNNYVRNIMTCVTQATTPLPTDHLITGYAGDLNYAAQEVLVNGADPMDALKEAEELFNERNVG